MEERKNLKVTRAERAPTLGPLDRPDEQVTAPAAVEEKALPAITEEMEQLHLQDNAAALEQETRRALTDHRIFETVPAAFSLSFVLGKQPADPDSLTIDELLVPPQTQGSPNVQSQNQYYLIILRTQHLLTTAPLTLSLRDLWSLWLLRAECLRALLAPRLAALELNRIKVPSQARIPWDFQVLKILLIGMASGRWLPAVNEWYAVAAETRVAMRKAEAGDKELWRARLRRLEELVAYGLVEAKNYETAIRYLKALAKRYPLESKYHAILYHVYLQAGFLAEAQKLLPSLPAEYQSESSAVLALATENYTQAIDKYSALLSSTIEPENPQPFLTYASNLAIAHLYTANVQAAISILESQLRDPANSKGTLPHTVYNLCTMYEIRDDQARSRKEGIMEGIVGRYGDVCGKGHFKLDSLR